MNTDSFKQRQLIFQNSSANQGNIKPKPRQSAPLINKDMFESKSKNNNINYNISKNVSQEANIPQKKNNLSTNPILKIANQMESKNKSNQSDLKNSINEKSQKDIKKKESILKVERKESENRLNQSDLKVDLKNSINEKSQKDIKKKESILKVERKESENRENKKENEKKEDKNDEKKEKEQENIIKEETKVKDIKKQIEKEIINKKEELQKEKELKASKKEDINNNEVKKDNKISEISKKFEKELKKENNANKGDYSFRKENSFKDIKIDSKINDIIKDMNINKEKNNQNNSIKNNLFLNNFKNSPSSNIIKNKEYKGSKFNLSQEYNSEKNNNNFEKIYNDLYADGDNSESRKESSYKIVKGKSLSDLEIDNFKDFNEEDYLERKYDISTIDKGKIFFKYRFLKNKYTQINETIKRLSNVNTNNIKNDIRYSAVNSTKFNFNNINNNNNINNSNQARNTINIDNKFKLSNNIHLSFFIKNPSAQCLNSIDKDSELRHNHSQFLQITEKSILCFNLKKFEESYLYLLSNNIIKNLEEYGEFLLVVNGFDKSIIGEFLSSSYSPNNKKEILKSFINSVKMNYDEIDFLECFRFFMKRFYLPKDANLILDIMNTFSEIYFNCNKNNDEFVSLFKNSNNIYLLISTLLAVNTMFTRKDIKNMNVIKKEEFIQMNKDIREDIVINIYEKLEKKPLLIDNENYNENIYKRMTTLVKEKISRNNSSQLMKSKTFNEKLSPLDIKKLDENPNFIINEEDSDEDYDSNLQIDSHSENRTSSRPFTRQTFSLTKNLYSFTKQDQEILCKIQKFYKLVGNETLHEREFLVYDNFTKLIWGKSVDQNKVKGNLHCLLLTDIFDVFNGIEHSENIKKYIKANPKELKEKNNFITIISNKKQINLKCNSLQTALLWYKALKSLVLKTKNENLIKNSKALNEINTQFKLQLEELWKDFILPKWNIYGNYILTKLKRKEKMQDQKEIKNPPKNIEIIIKDTENDKILEYSDFFQFFYLGLPSFCRGTIWRLLIGNSSCITETLYENYLSQVEVQNFNTFDIKYHEDINTIFNREYNINQMITDIIKTKDFFLSDLINLKIDQEQIMNESYNILRIFFLMRNDLVYKKSIVPLIFVFLMVDENEYNAFCNIYNLICNNDIIKFYIGDEDYINKNIVLFSNFVKKYLPKIHEHFTNLEIVHELYFIPWITEIFSSSMSYKLLLRVLDLYLINGEYILFQVGLSILSIQEDDLLDLAINEIFKLLKKLSSKYKEDFFLEKMKSFDCVKDEYNQWKNENELGTQKLQLFQAIFNDDK